MNTPLTLVSLPLFPLHTVLFPDGERSLRVFDPRYRSMLQGCLQQGAPFGLITLHGTDAAAQATPCFHRLGALSRIRSIASSNDQLDVVLCHSEGRFRTTATRQLPGGIWAANVELLAPDPVLPIPPDLQHSAHALRQVMHKLPTQSLAASDARLLQQCGWVANRWCELLPLDLTQQLQLLELDSPLLRLELVTDMLESSGIALRPPAGH